MCMHVNLTELAYTCIHVGQTKVLGEDVEELRRRMELLRTIGDSDVLAHAALLGEEEVIKEYLDEYPNDVSHAFGHALTYLAQYGWSFIHVCFNLQSVCLC